MTPVKCCNVCLSALQPSAQRCPSVQLQLGLHSRSLAARGRLPVSQQHQTTAAAAYNSLQGLPQQHIAAEPAAYTADAVAATSTGLPGPSSGSAAPAAVSLDVEYAHMRLAGGGEVSSPAWVALLDQHCSVLLKTYIQPEVRLQSSLAAPHAVRSTAASWLLQLRQGTTGSSSWQSLGIGLAHPITAPSCHSAGALV
jgi:hypothetical protein